jgi:hypothetical protein
MADRVIRQSDVPFRKLRRKEEKQVKACKKTSWTKTAAKIAVSSALTGDHQVLLQTRLLEELLINCSSRHIHCSQILFGNTFPYAERLDKKGQPGGNQIGLFLFSARFG